MATQPNAGRDIESTPEQVVIQNFAGADDAAVLRDIAAWIEADPARVLIGLWSTGFGEPWEVDLQVIATTLPAGICVGAWIAERAEDAVDREFPPLAQRGQVQDGGT